MSSIMEFLERDYMEEEVKVEITNRSIKVPLHEGFTELSKGAEYYLPRWVADLIVATNTGRIRDNTVSVEKLSEIVYNEESLIKKLQIIKLQGFFYLKVRNILDELNNVLKNSMDVNLIEEYRRLEELYDSIGRIRIKKLMNFILLPTVAQDVFDNMSEEEKILFTMIKSVLSNWIEKLRLGRI